MIYVKKYYPYMIRSFCLRLVILHVFIHSPLSLFSKESYIAAFMKAISHYELLYFYVLSGSFMVWLICVVDGGHFKAQAPLYNYFM